MATALFTHDDCFAHDPGRMHPESPARLKAVLAALDGEEFAGLVRREAPLAAVEQLSRVHPRAHVERVLALMPEDGRRALDPDTIVSSGSRGAALRAAGAVCAAVDAVANRTVRNAFCAVRPPGHHAEPDVAMGFCLFNNVAVGAAHARAVHRLERIAVVDFDVHHGNGTQAMFWDDACLFYASTHQSPLYPGTGRTAERGVSGNIVNMELRPMAGTQEFRAAVSEGVLPALRRFEPEIVLVSAGFDGHEDDPLAALRLTDDDFRWVTQQLADVAATCCEGRLVSTLEGGYDLHALARSAAIHVRALMTA